MNHNTEVVSRERHSNCTLCPLHLHAQTVCFWGRGNDKAEVMFVGEAPGEQEDRTGEPFVGKAGKRLTDVLTEIGLPRHKVYISNSCKCRPLNNKAPGTKMIR